MLAWGQRLIHRRVKLAPRCDANQHRVPCRYIAPRRLASADDCDNHDLAGHGGLKLCGTLEADPCPGEQGQKYGRGNQPNPVGPACARPARQSPQERRLPDPTWRHHWPVEHCIELRAGDEMLLTASSNVFGRRLLEVGEEPGCPEHCGDLNDTTPVAIDHSEGAHDDLAEVGIPALGHHPTRLREGTKAFYGCQDAANRKLGIAPRILSDVVANRLDIANGLRGLFDRRHWLSCRLTSSCEIPLPSSSSPSPASILAIKINRSIVSSNVASAGRSCSASIICSRDVGVAMIGQSTSGDFDAKATRRIPGRLNTRGQLQGAPQRPAASGWRRPHLRALSVAPRCWTVPCLGYRPSTQAVALSEVRDAARIGPRASSSLGELVPRLDLTH